MIGVWRFCAAAGGRKATVAAKRTESARAQGEAKLLDVTANIRFATA
jgi:hypothetical protein